MHRITLGLLAVVLATASVSVAQDTPYEKYERAKKTVTELEWRLLQAQLPLTPKEAYLSFDASRQRFNLIVWISTSDAAQQNTPYFATILNQR